MAILPVDHGTPIIRHPKNSEVTFMVITVLFPTGGHRGVVKILCELRAEIDKGAQLTGASPLFTASEYGHVEAAKIRGWLAAWVTVRYLSLVTSFT